MSVIEDLTEEECYLWAILQDESGLDQAEFFWYSPEEPDGCFRAWPYQWKWWRTNDPLQIDQCFAEGTLVLTERGHVPIEDVKVGDRVLTHKGRWRPVTYTWDRGEREVVEIKGHGHPGLIVTPDHKFWIDDSCWKVPQPGDRWTTPWRFPETTVPVLPERTYAPGRPSNIPEDVSDPDFLWLYGLFVAEGSCSSSFGTGGTVNRTTFSVHEDEVDDVEQRLRKVGLRFNTQRVASELCFNIVVNSRPLATWMSEHGGRGARSKHLAPWAFGLDDLQRKAILDGLAYGDGYTRSSGRVEYTTTSKALAADVKLLASSLGYFVTMTRYAGRNSVIDGRQIVGGEGFVVGWYMNGRHNHVDTVTPAGTARVYDLEVEEDHSFVAESIVVSNCARSVGKSLSIKVRGFAFPFLYPGQEMVITAPELVHLEPIVGLVERQFFDCRIGREMLPRGRSAVTHRPFQMNFTNGSRIVGRIPQRDGKGVKGIHPIWLELDEAQDYPEAGWTELVETLKRGFEGAVWRAHGVTRGVRDKFYEFTQERPDNDWKVHRYCLPGDTLVYGVDRPVPIKDIEVGTKVWSVTEHGDLVIEPVTAKVCNGVKETWRVKTKDRSLVTTGNHPYLRLQDYGTRKTRRELRWEWVNAEDLKSGDVIVEMAAVPQMDSGLGGDLRPGTHDVLMRKSPERGVPEWVWSAPRIAQEAFLHGYLVGDGSVGRQQRGQTPWQVGTSSKTLAKELLALCHYLGYRTTNLDEGRQFTSPVSKGVQYRFYVYPFDSAARAQVPRSYTIHDLGLDPYLQARTVLSVEKTGRVEETWDITVGENHNFVAEGVVVHNTAMHRPNWSDQERSEKIKQYGSRDHPDYRRNVLGLHGDATNPLFVLHRLMRCVDSDETSDYNQDEYFRVNIKDEWLLDMGQDITEVLDFPARHKASYPAKTATFWCGMDVGYTNHPSEILVFVDHRPNGQNKPSVLKLLTRIHLERIGHGDQVKAILWTIDYYKPRAFAMDKTGLGLPLFQDLQERAATADSYESHKITTALDAIKGYNFSSKILVDFDQSIEVDDYGDAVKEAGIERKVLEYSSDKLRELVDAQRLILPWDTDLIAEFQGQTWTNIKGTQDLYGRRIYSKGKFHALDAARMAALGHAQYSIEKLTKVEKSVPVYDAFI